MKAIHLAAVGEVHVRPAEQPDASFLVAHAIVTALHLSAQAVSNTRRNLGRIGGSGDHRLEAQRVCPTATASLPDLPHSGAVPITGVPATDQEYVGRLFYSSYQFSPD